jgi:predicted short-subunit dehydrogenase-like oxidoreductase (DUF2520 family)
LLRVVERLAAARLRLARKVVLHTSRLYSSGDLEPLRRLGAAVGSLQPLFVFQRPVPSLAGVFCAVEGDPAATSMARRMIRSWDGEFQLVQADQKIRLGIASSIAADFLPGLLEMAVQQLTMAGFLKKRSLRAISKVLDVAFAEYGRSGRRSRPGPLLQNDAVTIQAYVERLDHLDPAFGDLYRQLARQTLTIFKRKSDAFSFLDRPGGSGARVAGAAAGANQR